MKKSELIRKLKSAGCYFDGELSNHESWYSPITNQHFTIPRHDAKEIPNGTLNSIKKQSGVKL
ncbi:MAG: type II toxin-antitoxin system HicA family toxin [Bacteroidales bacterium]|nr:type II toxin-antitoxin system HicA family toxin [Bacteroidales bacterium]